VTGSPGPVLRAHRTPVTRVSDGSAGGPAKAGLRRWDERVAKVGLPRWDERVAKAGPLPTDAWDG